jgi:hypothetical protein
MVKSCYTIEQIPIANLSTRESRTNAFINLPILVHCRPKFFLCRFVCLHNIYLEFDTLYFVRHITLIEPELVENRKATIFYLRLKWFLYNQDT